jgi:hypothetical protein
VKVLQKAKIRAAILFSNPTTGYTTKGNEISVPKRHQNPPAYCNTIHKSKKCQSKKKNLLTNNKKHPLRLKKKFAEGIRVFPSAHECIHLFLSNYLKARHHDSSTQHVCSIKTRTRTSFSMSSVLFSHSINLIHTLSSCT